MKTIKIVLIILFALNSFSCTNSNKKEIVNRSAIPENEMEKGAQIYRAKCMTCHRKNGEGLKRVYPPLANSDYLKENTEDAVRMVKFGSDDEIEVNGIKYKNYMPPSGLREKELSLVFNYILNSWGNSYGRIEPETIRNIKEKK